MEKTENPHMYKKRSPAYLRRLIKRRLQREQPLIDAREALTEEVKETTATETAEQVDVAEEATQTEKVNDVALVCGDSGSTQKEPQRPPISEFFSKSVTFVLNDDFSLAIRAATAIPPTPPPTTTT